MADFQNTTRGYDVNATAKELPRGQNAQLNFRGQIKELWVQEVTTGFAMSGSRAQSYRTRSYFPHNFTQPLFTVSCQFPNQQTYADVVEFIRYTQTTFDSSVHLLILNRSTYAGRNLKGVHETIWAEGYIKHVARTHERHVYAPELNFEFVVERHLAPSGWRDTEGNQTPKKLVSWKEIIEGHKKGYVQDPDPPKQATPAPTSLSRPGVAPGPGTGNRPT